MRLARSTSSRFRMADRSPVGEARESLLRVARPGAKLDALSIRDWEFAVRVARKARLLPRLAYKIEQQNLRDRIPAAVCRHVDAARVVADKRGQVAVWELNRIVRALRSCPVPLVLLKGCAYLLTELPNAPGRSFADVDLLVPEAQLSEVEGALLASGWRSSKLSAYDQHYYRAWTHELPPLRHPERGVEVDVHHSILPRTSRLKPDSRRLLSDTRSMANSRFKTLSPVDMVLHAITHLFFDDDMSDSVRDLLDIDDLMRHFQDTEPGFWERFVPRARELNLERPAFYALRYARLYLETPIPDEVLASAHAGTPVKPVLWLMDRLVPRALFPDHPDYPSRLSALARWLLYVRSHWIRMPPLLLARHLSYKFYARRFKKEDNQHQQALLPPR